MRKVSFVTLVTFLALFASCSDRHGAVYFTQSSAGMMPGESCSLELRSCGMKIPFSQVTLECSDPQVATVNDQGQLSAVSEGFASVTARTQDGRTSEIRVRVYPEDFVRYSSPAGDKWPIFGYHTVMTEKRDFDVMQECGLNIAMTTCGAEENLKILEEIDGMDIKLAPYVTRNLEPQKAVELFSKYNNFALYYVNDEPSFDPEDPMAAKARELQKLDPSHPTYLNLLPLMADTTAYGGIGYRNYVKGCACLHNSNFISFDHYPIYIDRATRDTVVRAIYFENLRDMAQASTDCAIPFWSYAMSIEHHKYPYPEEGHLRFQHFVCLAYGSQGFSYFEYSHALGEPEYHGALYNQETHEKERSWEAARAINMELQAYAPYLQGGQMLYLMGPAGYPGTNEYDASKLPWPVRSVTASNGTYIVSHLCNMGHEYMAVVNCNPFAQTEVALEFGSGIKKISKDGKLVRARGNETLAPGDILLYKLN